MKRIIFYFPQEISDSPTKGSELRPANMLKAFIKLGFEVEVVVGDSMQRKKAIKKIRHMINIGIIFDFLYAESTNLTVLLSDSHHFPIRPFLDYSFFRFLNKNKIPIGFFYRDLYWRFKELRPKSSIIFLFKHFFYWIEWYGIVKTVDHLFLPTYSISKYLPSSWPEEHLSALYPGFDSELQKTKVINNKKEPLNLLYVGGVKPPYYDLSPLFHLMDELLELKLTVITRKHEWDIYKSYYTKYNFKNIDIAYANNKEIANFYQTADLVLDIREPIGYLKTAMPIKIIESIGFELPVLLMHGTESAQFVYKENSGWVVSKYEDAKKLLKKLDQQRELIENKINKIKKIKNDHTWEKRAIQVAMTLVKSNFTDNQR